MHGIDVVVFDRIARTINACMFQNRTSSSEIATCCTSSGKAGDMPFGYTVRSSRAFRFQEIIMAVFVGETQQSCPRSKRTISRPPPSDLGPNKRTDRWIFFLINTACVASVARPDHPAFDLPGSTGEGVIVLRTAVEGSFVARVGTQAGTVDGPSAQPGGVPIFRRTKRQSQSAKTFAPYPNRSVTLPIRPAGAGGRRYGMIPRRNVPVVSTAARQPIRRPPAQNDRP